jgi:hypothetical protein
MIGAVRARLSITAAGLILTRSPSRLAALLGVALFATSGTAQAKPASLDLRAQRELRFGSFGVMASGARVVSPTGAVTNQSIFPVPGGITGPAEFAIVYDRGNESRMALNLVIDLTVLSIPRFTTPTLSGTLSDLTSDLPGAPGLTSGQVVRLTINNCLTRTCQISFKVGGRLQVDRSGVGGAVSIPIPMSVTLVEVNGRRP